MPKLHAKRRTRKGPKSDIRATINRMREERSQRRESSSLPDLIGDIAECGCRFFVPDGSTMRLADNVDLVGRNLGASDVDSERDEFVCDEEERVGHWRDRAYAHDLPWSTNPNSFAAHYYYDAANRRVYRAPKDGLRCGRYTSLPDLAKRLGWSFDEARAWADGRFEPFGGRVAWVTVEVADEMANSLASAQNDMGTIENSEFPHTSPYVTGRRAVAPGQQFGRGVVTGRVNRPGDQRHSWWSMTCACGTHFVARGDRLVGGRTVSCGCRRTESKTEYADRGAVGELIFDESLTASTFDDSVEALRKAGRLSPFWNQYQTSSDDSDD